MAQRHTGLCLFDLDGTLTEGRTVFRLAARLGRTAEVTAALAPRGAALGGGDEPAAGDAESRRVMAAFAGVREDEFVAACRDARLRPGAERAVAGLRALGFRVAVVTATYRPAAQAAVERLDLDTAFALEPEVRDGVLTGRLGPAPCPGPCGRPVCKGEALARLRRPREATVAVGDGANDVCMITAADFGVAVEPCHPAARAVADAIVKRLDEVPGFVRRLWLPAQR